MDLLKIRKEIDGIDSEIIRLLSRRGKLVSMAGKLKKDEHAVVDPARVEEVIKKVRIKAGENDLSPEIAEQVYRTITSCFINAELKEFDQMKRTGPAPCRVYRKDELHMKEAVCGAMMWAVGLEKAMLTYFELGPNAKFEKHSHEAEQITLILEGEMTFVHNGKETVLREGEVIAIPSNAVHSAHTGDFPCKAVDAWSPVRKEYLEK